MVGAVPVPYGSRTVEAVAADLDRLLPKHFDPWDEAADGPDRLGDLCDEMARIGDVAVCAPILFRTMERLDGADVGSPGPLVHTIERWRGDYERHLVESMERMPSSLAVWMVNRVLNAGPPGAEMWLRLLRQVVEHPEALAATKAEAQGFLDYQLGPEGLGQSAERLP